MKDNDCKEAPYTTTSRFSVNKDRGRYERTKGEPKVSYVRILRESWDFDEEANHPKWSSKGVSQQEEFLFYDVG